MEGWYCKGCYSLNRPRADRCYSCGERGGMAESVMPAAPGWWQAPRSTDGEVQVPAGRYRPADFLAWAVIVFIGLSIAVSAAILVVLGTSPFPLDVVMLSGSTGRLVLDLFIVSVLLAIAAPIAWFLWFDRVLCNVAPLGGGQPASSRLGAIVWWFVPVAWFYKPARAVGDVYRRLAVPGTPGAWLPAFWWLSWVGGTLVPPIFGFIFGFVAGLRRLPMQTIREGAAILDFIGAALEIVSGVLAIVMIIAIQRAQAARASATSGPGAGPVAWDASGPTSSPVPMPIPTRPGTLPARSLIVVGAIIASGLGASAALAQGRPAPAPLPAAPATADPTPSVALPMPSASPAPTSTPGSDWTAADRLRSIVLDAGSDYSARITLEGSLDTTGGGVSIHEAFTGTIVVSGDDFRSRVRVDSTVPELRDDTSVALVDGRAFVRQGEEPWSAASELPDGFGFDPFMDLLWSHDLVDRGPAGGSDDGLVLIEWPLLKASMVGTMADTLGDTFRSSGASATILVRPDGTPVEVRLHVEGTYRESGQLVTQRIALSYRYSDVGEAVVVEDPRTGD